jgi:hypothetical protein
MDLVKGSKFAHENHAGTVPCWISATQKEHLRHPHKGAPTKVSLAGGARARTKDRHERAAIQPELRARIAAFHLKVVKC